MFGTRPSLAFTASTRSLALPAADSGEIALKRDTGSLSRSDHPQGDHATHLRERSSSAVGSGLHFQDDFQFHGRTEWQARHTNDKARRDGLFAEDVSEQLRRGIGDLWVLSELRRRGDVHAEPD